MEIFYKISAITVISFLTLTLAAYCLVMLQLCFLHFKETLQDMIEELRISKYRTKIK